MELDWLPVNTPWMLDMVSRYAFDYIIGGLHSDVKAYFKTYEKIEALEQTEHIKIIPGHDVHVLDHKVYPVSVEEGSE